MSSAVKLASNIATFVLAVATLAGCSHSPVPATDSAPLTTDEPTPTPSYPSELPDWAREGNPLWLVYPDGFKCRGTEGCPNDYRALIGEPGPVLPEGVEYYDAEKHECVVVAPVGVDCMNRSGELSP